MLLHCTVGHPWEAVGHGNGRLVWAWGLTLRAKEPVGPQPELVTHSQAQAPGGVG